MMKKILLVIAILSLGVTVVWAKVNCPFEGYIDFNENIFQVNFKTEDQGEITARIKRNSSEELITSLNFDHFKTPTFELSTELVSSLMIRQAAKDAGLILTGQLLSQYTLINLKPIQELAGTFEIKERTLYINSFSNGGIVCTGKVELFAPYKVDLEINLNSIELNDFLSFWVKNKKFRSQGLVSGQLRFTGAINDLAAVGQIASYRGVVGSLDYDSIVLNVDGPYPNIHLVKSTIAKSDGTAFVLEGDLDLNDQDNFIEQIKKLSKSPVVDSSERDSEWTLKRWTDEEGAATELKYLKRKEDIGNLDTEDESNMFGIERKMEF